MTIALYIILGVAFGALLVWLGLKPKLRVIAEEDAKIKNMNELAKAELNATRQAQANANIDLENTRTALAAEKVQVANIHSQIQEGLNTLDNQRKEKELLMAEIANAQKENEKIRLNVADALDRDLDNLREKYDQAKAEAENEYLTALDEYKQQMEVVFENDKNNHQALLNTIQKEQSIVQSITDERERAAKDKSLYMLSITADDLDEINALRNVAKTFRDATPVNKLIWSAYYQKPYKVLILNTLGPEKTCGIYAITDTSTEKKYIGQSVDVATRWSDHIKRGLGAEKGADTKLYQAMKEHGVENFKFELLEEVPRERLNEQEKFWIDFYSSVQNGLNTTKGNS